MENQVQVCTAYWLGSDLETPTLGTSVASQTTANGCWLLPTLWFPGMQGAGRKACSYLHFFLKKHQQKVWQSAPMAEPAKKLAWWVQQDHQWICGWSFAWKSLHGAYLYFTHTPNHGFDNVIATTAFIKGPGTIKGLRNQASMDSIVSFPFLLGNNSCNGQIGQWAGSSYFFRSGLWCLAFSGNNYIQLISLLKGSAGTSTLELNTFTDVATLYLASLKTKDVMKGQAISRQIACTCPNHFRNTIATQHFCCLDLLCDTLTSSVTFQTPDVTKQSWKAKCPAKRRRDTDCIMRPWVK